MSRRFSRRDMPPDQQAAPSPISTSPAARRHTVRRSSGEFVWTRYEDLLLAHTTTKQFEATPTPPATPEDSPTISGLSKRGSLKEKIRIKRQLAHPQVDWLSWGLDVLRFPAIDLDVVPASNVVRTAIPVRVARDYNILTC